jgi:RNA polymerase sigma factor (sigma-70 family)
MKQEVSSKEEDQCNARPRGGILLVNAEGRGSVTGIMHSDIGLIRAYARTGSEEAFAEIVRRHGGTVYRTCLRILGEVHAAEDAAQATFLVLARKARSLRRNTDLAAWLHVVGRRAAQMSARSAARRAHREEEATMRRVEGAPREAPEERAAITACLDRELARLPCHERQAVVLRYLEDRSVSEAAEVAGCPQGTLTSRAARGLERLRFRLVSQGIAPGTAALASVLAAEAAAPLPETLLPSLLAASSSAVNGAAAAAGGRSAVALAKGVTKAMFWTKVKIATIVVTVAAGTGAGAQFAYGALGGGERASKDGGARAPAPAASQTALGRLAASLKPGEMKALKTKGFTGDLIKSWYDWDAIENGVRKYGAQHMGNIITAGWANDAKWDPVTGRILYFGGCHYASFKFVTYSEKANEWKLMPVPVWVDPRIAKTSKEHGWCNNGWQKDKKTGKKTKCWPRGHSYDCNAIWPEKRIYALTLWSWMRLYDLDEDQWLPSVPGFRTNSSGPCEAFPELGGFLCFSRPNQLCLYDPLNRKKRNVVKIGFGVHGIMEYNPVHKVAIVGGGDARNRVNRHLWLVDREGKVKKLKPTPDWLRCTPYGKVMCDPVSGEYIIQGHRPRKNKEGFGKTWAFHPLKDEWKEIPTLRFPAGLGVVVDTYGVIVIVSPGRVSVYRHKPMWPDAGIAGARSK